jgi:peptide/nickel transport system permease protein
MLAEGRNGVMTYIWWPAVFPGLAIMAVVGASNLLGDWIRIRLDPRLQEVL